MAWAYKNVLPAATRLALNVFRALSIKNTESQI